MTTAVLTLRSYEFRREREATWKELDDLVTQVERKGIKSLSSKQLSRLPVLYRATLSSLSVARTISLDQNVLRYLESLAGRAYFCVYGTRRHMREVIGEFFRESFPNAVRAARWQIALAALAMILGAVAAFVMTARDQDKFYTFVGAEYAQGRNPGSSTADLKAALYDEVSSSQVLTTFAASLFSHNAKIGIMSFALGFALGLPVFILMFLNGTILGAFAALYHERGLSADLWGWLLPHGVTELSAIVLCGGAGLVLAQSLVFPGHYKRLQNLALRGRDAGQIVLGAVIMFFIAGLIEGIFRQTVQSMAIRYAVATTTAAFWIYYFGFVGRRRA